MVVPEKRRLEIKEIIKKDESVSVADLSKSFKVSELTIRRDLKKLEDTGFLEKVHGGAIARGSRSEWPVCLVCVQKSQTVSLCS